MGNAAKIVLVAATSLVVGVYAVSLKKVQTINLQAALTYVDPVETDCGIEDAALRVVVFRVQNGVTQYRGAGNSTAITISATRTALGGGSYYYNLYVPYGTWYATGYVDVTPLNKPVKRINVRVDKMIGTGVSFFPSTPKGTKPGYRSYVRSAWQITQSTR